eukprot:428743-Prymnesium_polylepis.1
MRAHVFSRVTVCAARGSRGWPCRSGARAVGSAWERARRSEVRRVEVVRGVCDAFQRVSSPERVGAGSRKERQPGLATG